MVLLFVYFFLDVNTLLGLKKTQKYFKYWSKQYFFRGCEHPKVIRELTPSWDGCVLRMGHLFLYEQGWCFDNKIKFQHSLAINSKEKLNLYSTIFHYFPCRVIVIFLWIDFFPGVNNIIGHLQHYVLILHSFHS